MHPRLAPFELHFADAVCRWARESPTFAPWTSLPSHDTFRAALADPHVAPHLLFEHDRPVAYGEVWSESAPDEIELARIIVDPDMRRRGLGSALTRELIAVARAHCDAPIWVRVMQDNAPALACYAKLGFVRASAEDERRFNEEAQSPGMQWLTLATGV